MNSPISADLIMHIAKKEGYMEQLPLLETMPEFTIDPAYLTEIPVAYNWISSKGISFGTLSSTNHPAFAALREFLASMGYVRIERGWSNGDVVTEPFLLNGYEFEVGEKFYSAGAMAGHLYVRKRKVK